MQDKIESTLDQIEVDIRKLWLIDILSAILEVNHNKNYPW